VSRILLVEDVADLATELQASVPEGHEIIVAISRSEAVGLLDREPIDLVVTALVLEAGDYSDGLAVTRAAADRPLPIPAIIVASFSTPETCLKAIQAGAFDYIERNSPGIAFERLLGWKISKALASRESAAGVPR